MIDLSQFCYPDDGNEERFKKLGRPWSAGDYSFAASGWMLVRVDRRPDVPENDHAPAAEKIEELLRCWHDKLVAMPPVELPPAPAEPADCLSCLGRGTEHACPECRCECEDCDGTGKRQVPESVSVGIGKAVFQACFIRQMLTLPGLEICAKPLPDGPMPFKFTGGIGLVMPFRGGKLENHIKLTMPRANGGRTPLAPQI